MDKLSNQINIPRRSLPLQDTSIKPPARGPVEQNESFLLGDSFRVNTDPSSVGTGVTVPELREKPAESLRAEATTPPPTKRHDNGPIWTEDLGNFDNTSHYGGSGQVLWDKHQNDDGSQINRVFLPKSLGNELADSLKSQGFEVFQTDPVNAKPYGALRCISQFLEREPSEG